MKIKDWLIAAEQLLTDAGVSTPHLDALVLLEDTTGKDRAQLLAHPELQLSTNEQNVLKAQLERRAQHEPLAYVRGKTEFYGREFVITHAVLEPRPESETMIDLLLHHPGRPAEPRIADVGAGSGALGITARLELPGASVDLLEIDPKAIEVAERNVVKFTIPVNVLKSDLLAQSTQNYDVLLCNLPYVPDAHTINASAMHEPRIAIFGGLDGLDLYRRLFTQLDEIPKRPLLILSESLPPQHAALQQIAASHGYLQTREDDFIQAFGLHP